MSCKLLAHDRRTVSPDRQRAAERLKLRGLELRRHQLREILVGLTFKLYEDDVAPDYRVHELKVIGGRAYAVVEQLQGYGAGRFTVAMKVRDNHPDYPGELVAVLPWT